VKIIVLVKQVPDTKNITGEAMTPEGTVNRAALPAVFNPDDLYALEAALQIKDANPGTTVTVITMGPLRRRQCLKNAFIAERILPPLFLTAVLPELTRLLLLTPLNAR